MDIHWYPGHMAKTRRQIKERLKLINVAVIAVDARAPKSTISPDLVKLLSGKECVIVLNKSDLADKEQTRLWTAYYKNLYNHALSFCAVKDKPAKLLSVIDTAAVSIKKRYAQKGVKKTIRVLVAGVPNVGKSAIINRLIGRKSTKEGDKPGVTRALQWVRLSNDLELLDSPGLLWPKIELKDTAKKIAVLGSLKQELVEQTALAHELISMLRCRAPGAVGARYGVDEKGEAFEVLSQICIKRGFLLKRGELDIERGARTLLDEFREGRLGAITLETVKNDG